MEGKNIVIEWRYAEGKFDRLPELAAELVRLKVDVIVTGGPNTTRPAKEATITIPIVMAFDGDPVGNGFVASLARSGREHYWVVHPCPGDKRKTTGASERDCSQAFPRGRPREFDPRGQRTSVKRGGTRRRGVRSEVQYLEVRGPKDIETVFRAASEGRADAVLVLGSPVLVSRQTQVADLAAKNRLPAIYPQSDYMDAGGLMSYGVSITEMYRRAATYVDKILKGAKPADLPVEQPKKFEFIINLKAAKQIGLTIPPNVLARADKVIK